MANLNAPNAVDLTTLLTRALDGLATRQQVTANNVANAETPGFKASEVRFEDALRQALAGDQPGSALILARADPRHLTSAAEAAGFAPRIEQLTATSLRNDGNNVDIDQQMALLAQTSIQYSAVTEALNRRFGIQRLLATEGRG